MEGGLPANDPYDVGAPQYTSELPKMALSLALGVVAFLALFATEVPFVWRAAGAGGGAALGLVAVNIWFASRWLWSQWRRARVYGGLLATARALQDQLAAWEGKVALAAQPPSLTVEGVYEAHGRLLIVLASENGPPLRRDDTLLVVDTLRQRLVGKARVLTVEPPRCEAQVHEPLDGVFWGFVRQEIGAYRRQLPAHAEVFREADVAARQRAIASLMEGVQR